MFTGIIETLGTIADSRREGSSIVLSVEPDRKDFTVTIGGSVAVDGACLTLESQTGNRMRFSAVAETLDRTTLGSIRTGRRVNLERAALVDGRLDGHLVYGHVDGVGSIQRDREMNGSLMRTISVPKELSRFMAYKGSVSIDGISLTIAQCDVTSITISFIPHTLSATTMVHKRPGDPVNIECDIIARYLHRLLQKGGTAGPTANLSLQALMERVGF
ncbi:MAG: riboflavin synthase [Chitinispirillaceae bacterium]|nr:riboflavin synthase [Chitinispirillaceae bacterium]